MPVSTRREFLQTLRNLSEVAVGAAILGSATSAEARRRQATPAHISEVDRLVHQRIAELRQQGVLSPRDKTSVLVYGLHSDKHFVRINVDEQRMAASLIKPFIMLVAYHRIAKGKKAYAGFESDVRQMIVHSDNNATNRVLRFVGGPQTAHRIVRAYDFDKTTIVQYIPAGGRTYRNKTSARNLNALLWKLHNGQLISAAYSRKMLDHLDHYATSRLAALQGEFDVDLAGKTGFVSGLNGEATRVSYPSSSGPRHYNFVAMVENRSMPGRRGGEWGKRTSRAIRQIFKTVHEQMTRPS